MNPSPHRAPSEAEIVAQLEHVARCRSTAALRAICEQLCEQLGHADGLEYFGDMTPEFLAAELQQIIRARTLERAKYYGARLHRATTESKPAPHSDLDLFRWKQYDDIETGSLWEFPTRDRSGNHAADYWGNFIPQIPDQLMRRFTRRGEWVLDGFAGSGTTLLECLRLGRNGLGVELQSKRVDETRKLLRREPNPYDATVRLRQGNSATFDYGRALQKLGATTAQLLILHPPYHDIIRFSDQPEDLSNAPDGQAFVDSLVEVTERGLSVLDRDRYVALVIGDKYADSEWVPLGFQSMEALQRLGLKLKSVIVKNFDKTAGKRGQEELWRYRALAGGFYVFKHEYIFLFQKL